MLAITALTGILNKGMEKRLQSSGKAMIQINPENTPTMICSRKYQDFLMHSKNLEFKKVTAYAYTCR